MLAGSSGSAAALAPLPYGTCWFVAFFKPSKGIEPVRGGSVFLYSCFVAVDSSPNPFWGSLSLVRFYVLFEWILFSFSPYAMQASLPSFCYSLLSCLSNWFCRCLVLIRQILLVFSTLSHAFMQNIWWSILNLCVVLKCLLWSVMWVVWRLLLIFVYFWAVRSGSPGYAQKFSLVICFCKWSSHE